MAEALERSGVALPDDVVDTYWNAITQPASVPQKLLAYERRAKELQKAMTETLKADIKANTSRIAEAKSSVHEFVELGDIDLAEDRLAAVEAMDARLAELNVPARCTPTARSRRAARTHQGQPLFREWEPYANLWRVCRVRAVPAWSGRTARSRSWTRRRSPRWWRPGTAPSSRCSSTSRASSRMCAPSSSSCWRALETNLPIVASLRKLGLRDRHWKDMSEDLGFAVKADAEFSLARAVQLGLHRHIDVLEKYSEAASKEYFAESPR